MEILIEKQIMFWFAVHLREKPTGRIKKEISKIKGISHVISGDDEYSLNIRIGKCFDFEKEIKAEIIKAVERINSLQIVG